MIYCNRANVTHYIYEIVQVKYLNIKALPADVNIQNPVMITSC